MSALLDVTRLSRSFGGLQAVKELTFSVQKGEIVGLIGPNGAGKTTAVNLISGNILPSSGDVHFAGEKVTGLRPSRLCAKGLVRTFQHTAIYHDRTVGENARRATYLTRYCGALRSLLPDARARARREQADARASEYLAMFGLQSEIDTLAGSLPYGHQKILGIILAMVTSPELILLDEPVAGLSAEETDRVRDVIKQIRADGVSVMVIEHNMRFISGLCDRVVVVAHGQELAQGVPSDVLRNPKVIEAYLGSSHVPTDHS